MKRDRELVLIAYIPLVSNKKQIVPKPRVGTKFTNQRLTLQNPSKFSHFSGQSEIDVSFSFVPRQFNVNFNILAATKLPNYPIKIPVVVQLLKFQLLQISSKYYMTEDEDIISSAEEDEDEELMPINGEKSKKKKDNIFTANAPPKQSLNALIGDLNSGHFKLDRVPDLVIWHGFLRWFREMQPHCLFHDIIVSHENIVSKVDVLSDKQLLISILSMPATYVSLLLWLIDFVIEMSQWVTDERRDSIDDDDGSATGGHLDDNIVINALTPALFGVQSKSIFMLPKGGFEFVHRIVHLRQQQKLKM